jgi:putative phosphoribosyl transferase
VFRNRSEAGRILAEELGPLATGAGVLVLGLPRGGVPVAFEVARALKAELDVCVVRKLGVPGEEELALGAIATGGVRVLNEELIAYMRVSAAVLEQVTARERKELERRERLYREGRPPALVHGRTVVLVDDGLATGASMLAASRAVRAEGPARIIVAAPVAARETRNEFRSSVDAVICVATPRTLGAVGMWYEDFGQVTDEDVRKLLEQAAHNIIAEAAHAGVARAAGQR